MSARALGENGQELTDDELRVIRVFRRLDRNWPDGLRLVSMAGAVHLMRGGQDHGDGLDQAESLWSSTRISNTGGDW